MLDEKGEPLFVGMDVAKVLGYSNYRDAIRKHVDNEDKDGVANRDAIGRDQKMVVINGSSLIFDDWTFSRLDDRRWREEEAALR